MAKAQSLFYEIKKLKKMKKEQQQEEKWTETKNKLKNKFALLSENDLINDIEKQDVIIGRLQKVLGKSKEEIEKIISEF